MSEIQIDLGEYTITTRWIRFCRYFTEKTGCGGIFLLYLEYRLREGTDPRFEKVLPQVRIWMGGPEASYDAVHLMDELPEVELIMQAKARDIYAAGGGVSADGGLFSEIPALSLRCSDDTVEAFIARRRSESGRHSFSYGDWRAGTPHYLLREQPWMSIFL